MPAEPASKQDWQAVDDFVAGDDSAATASPQDGPTDADFDDPFHGIDRCPATC